MPYTPPSYVSLTRSQKNFERDYRRAWTAVSQEKTSSYWDWGARVKKSFSNVSQTKLNAIDYMDTVIEHLDSLSDGVIDPEVEQKEPGMSFDRYKQVLLVGAYVDLLSWSVPSLVGENYDRKNSAMGEVLKNMLLIGPDARPSKEGGANFLTVHERNFYRDAFSIFCVNQNLNQFDEEHSEQSIVKSPAVVNQ